ncbi:MAG: hypothetical protein BGN84_01570 [Afipia sp. 62-7]|nr:hypothetical protein [Afipia sp.]OJU20583.1 MAG: hypothetical protein BGN84_01570 [Afipia sp. 62-7]
MTARQNRSEFLRTGNVADGGPIEAASLVAETVADLTQLAKRHNLDTLGYLLDMAQLEADEIVRRGIPPGTF